MWATYSGALETASWISVMTSLAFCTLATQHQHSSSAAPPHTPHKATTGGKKCTKIGAQFMPVLPVPLLWGGDYTSVGTVEMQSA
ncbi:hypothetical protein E2C01_060156 [Portunus trituberculatus]|uniref:Secreted protein n=1 Tax=Portunus trituberculatus TaxID=210409 RepID=A0A5B7H7B0_PORTR|nr:hypothetical protein [Portunus trituberculatus]